jgi:Flp pilus assembly protein TadG
MARHKNDAGQAIILFAFTIIVLMGFAGLGVDMGYLRYMRRTMQAATDSAALAGAAEIGYNDVTSAAKADASTNGFTDGSNGTTVTVNNPPLSGPYQGESAYVEVLIAQNQPTFFMKVLGVYSHMVSTRAVAFVGNAGACVYGLDPSAQGTVKVSGNVTVDVKCGVLDNSNNDAAAVDNGTNGCLTATGIGVVGGYKEGSCGFTPTPVTGIAAFSDPLAYLQPPTTPTTNGTCTTSGGTTTCYPGLYTGGINISGGNRVFSSGTYYINGGGINITGGATVTGNGVTFYLSGTSSSYKGVSIAGGTNVTLIAPTDSGDPYENVLFFQDRSITKGSTGSGSSINGGTGVTLQGVLYFPTTSIQYSGTSANAEDTILIGDTITFTGNTVLYDTFAGVGGGLPIHKTTLVE